jgi:hypothetical protein
VQSSMLKLRILSTFVLISGTLFAQANLDVRKMPELGAHVVFDAVSGAVSYNWYESSAVGDCTKSGYSFDHNQATPVYDDDPFPGWYKVNVQNRGSWQRNWWCYWMAPVFADGSVGKLAGPAIVRIGLSGYVTLHYKSGSCTGPNLNNPYSFSQLDWKIFYRDSAGVNHQMNVIENVASATTLELEWKLPDIALDGTVVLLLPNTFYYYELVTPDGLRTSGAITPYYGADAFSYTQINLYKVMNGPQCVVGYGTAGANYSWPQNVIR